MAISEELLNDLLRIANEKGLLKLEDMEVLQLQTKKRPAQLLDAVHDLAAKLVVRIRHQRGEPLPPEGPTLKVGEMWHWYAENGGTMPLDDLENPEGFVE